MIRPEVSISNGSPFGANLFSASVDFLVLDISYTNGIIHYVVFCDSLFSLSIMFSRLIDILSMY